jgi:glutamyl-tRNA reductase
MTARHVLAVGVSHHTARLELRERIALDEDAARALLRSLVAGGAVAEAFVVSTCNRTEVYAACRDVGDAERAIADALARVAEIPSLVLRAYCYVHRDELASRHLFNVASGLDSMIVGETQILGQLRRAGALADEAGTSGPVVERMLREALGAGRRVRERTAIARASVSVSSAAVELARGALGELAGRRVLVVGAGKSGELTAQALASHGVEVVVLSRCPQRAARLAGAADGAGGGLEELERELERADAVVTATSAPTHVISRSQLSVALAARGARELLVLDLAVPRDVEPSARSLEGLVLLDLDDVQARAEANLRARRADAGRARALAAEEAARFERWRSSLGAVETVSALRRRADAIVDGLLADNDPRWEGLTDADRDRVAALAHAVASRLLDAPTRALKASASDAAALDAARTLFELDAGAAPASLRAVAG